MLIISKRKVHNMSIIEELKEENNKAFVTWFERWWNNEDLMNKIRIANSKGYNRYRLTYDINSNDKYLMNRLSDDRIVEIMEEKLGDGFMVIKDIVTHERGKLFGVALKDDVHLHIVIDWSGD